MYLYLNSSDCLFTHPQNVPSDFTIDLPEPLHFDNEKYEIAVTEVLYKGKRTIDLYMFCNICDTTFVREKTLPILRIIRQPNEIFAVPYYIPIYQKNISTVHVYLRDKYYNPVSFSKDYLRCTLHIRTLR